MRSARSSSCVVCGPFTDELTMVEFEDTDDDPHHICVDCLMGVFESVDMPQEAMNAFAAAWSSAVLGTPTTVVPDGG